MQSSSTHTKINHKPCCCLVELSRASISSSSRGVDGGEVHSLLLLLGVQSWEVVHHEGHQHAGKDTCTTMLTSSTGRKCYLSRWLSSVSLGAAMNQASQMKTE